MPSSFIRAEQARLRRGDYDINYRIRSVALVRDLDMRPMFEVICYGWGHSTLATIDISHDELEPSMSGGTRIARRLATRGIDTTRLTMTVFDTAPIIRTYREPMR